MRALIYLFAILLPLTMHGGIKRGSTAEIEKNIVNVYEENGSLNLAVIFDLPVGTKLRFKLPNEDGMCEGEITNIKINPNENMAVIGKLVGEGNPGFIFIATTNKTVGGALFFPEKGIAYGLLYDDAKQNFLLEKKKFEARQP